MSRGPENTFIASIHKLLPEDLYAMKNHNEYNGGIADCWYSGVRDLWVEYKFLEVPKRGNTIINLVRRPSTKTPPVITELQQDWISERSAQGRDVWIIVGCKDGGVIFRDDGWTVEHSAAKWRGMVVPRQAVAQAIVAHCMG
jgi:hypothetical protein